MREEKSKAIEFIFKFPSVFFSRMSNEDSIVPIKLAQTFIHVIDFHADPVTCVSASSGTVSYDSILSARHGRVDLLMKQDAIHCTRQPPRPHHVSKLKRVFNRDLIEKPIKVDIETFQAVRKEHIIRKLGVKESSKPVNDFVEVSKQMDLALKECLLNFQKPKEDETKKAVFNITIEFPSSIPVPVTKPKEKFIIHQKTLTRNLSSQILDSFGSNLDGQQQTDVALKMFPHKTE